MRVELDTSKRVTRGRSSAGDGEVGPERAVVLSEAPDVGSREPP